MKDPERMMREARTAEEHFNAVAASIAAKGKHTLLVGPPGSGKTAIAWRVIDHLGHLKEGDAFAMSRIHQLAGLVRKDVTDYIRPPFRAPHHTVSVAGLAGSAPDRVTCIPRFGELTLAHAGVLFLDDAPEFSRQALGVVAQAVRDGVVAHGTRTGVVEYPAKFLLVLAMSPCPCGGHRGCQCTDGMKERYRARINPVREYVGNVVEL